MKLDQEQLKSVSSGEEKKMVVALICSFSESHTTMTLFF